MGFMTAAVALLAIPFALCALYLFVLTLCSGRLDAPELAPGRLPRFDVIVPAHDEEAGIARTVRNLLALDYPKNAFRVRVVADNCTDATAHRARQEGADVLERFDANLRGKGYALAFAFEQSLREGFADAVVVIDADSVASANLLQAFAARIGRGASAVQAEYGVSNPEQSWRTQLMRLAFALFHGVRSLGRERLGLSCGLRGNGMCFTRELLQKEPHRAFSVVEDVEYGIQIGRSGHRVHFAHEAEVLGEMTSDERASGTQRQRWEAGRSALIRTVLPPLVRDAARTRSGLLGDLAMDLVVPPLAQLVGCLGVGSAVALGLAAGGHPGALLPWLAGDLFVAAYVLRGWVLSGLGWTGAALLARAPVYLAWKIGLKLRGGGRRPEQWVRTARDGEGAR